MNAKVYEEKKKSKACSTLKAFFKINIYWKHINVDEIKVKQTRIFYMSPKIWLKRKQKY